MQRTSLEALRSLDSRPLKEHVFDHLVRCDTKGSTDEEIEQALRLKHQTASARRRDLVKEGRVVDSGHKRKTSSGRKAIVWMTKEAAVDDGGHGMDIPPPPKLPGGVQATEPEPAPDTPKPTLIATQKGIAAVLVAALLETVAESQYRLVWHTDLKRVYGEAAAQVSDPTDPTRGDRRWGEILDRLKAALDAQPHRGQNCRFAMTIDYMSRSTGRHLRATFDIPCSVDLSLFVGRPPPVGTWYLFPCPDVPPGDIPAGERAPAISWYDYIPF